MSVASPARSLPTDEAGADRPLRLHSLTAMRFFAAFIVVLYHSWPSFTGNTGLGYLSYGYLSVGFFFLLSGVVLAWSWKPGLSVVAQWRRRVARIAPLYWLLMLVVAAFFWSGRVPPPSVAKADGEGFLLVMTFTQAWPPFEHVLDYNAPGWSLSTEMFFYLLFPLFIPLLAKLGRTALVVTGCALLAGFVLATILIQAAHWPMFGAGNLLIFPPLQLFKFAAGACFGLALRRGWRITLQPGTALAVLIAVVALVPTLQRAWHGGASSNLRATEIFPDLMVVFPVAMLIVATACADLRGQTGLGSSRVLRTLGDWSFALYLVHMPALFVVPPLLHKLGANGHPGYWWYLVYLIGVVVASGILHRFVEIPAERLLSGRRKQATAAADEPAKTP